MSFLFSQPSPSQNSFLFLQSRRPPQNFFMAFFEQQCMVGGAFPWAMENTLADVKRKKERINFLKLIIINIIVGVGFGKAKAFFLQTTFLPSSFLS